VAKHRVFAGMYADSLLPGVARGDSCLDRQPWIETSGPAS
jgi:hypothetical protein